MPELADLIIISVLTVASAVIMLICSYKMLQIYQMSSYRTSEVFTWLKKTKFEYLARYFSLAFFIFVPTSLFVACFGGYKYFQYIGYLFFVILSLIFVRVTKKQVKVPLKLTKRMIRLSLLLTILYIATLFPLFLLSFHFFLQYSLIAVVPFFIPILTMLANTIMLPVECAINSMYKRRASKKLESMPNLIKIGITGSYGKTTVKNILAAFLSKKYKVCSSPKSYNTPMGLTRVINDTLQADDDILIAEMGARYVGDIAELCRLIKPRVGILTAIGDMHLETFGTKENLLKTKYELIDSLSPSGIAVYSGDDETLRELYHSCDKNKLISNSTASRIKNMYSNVEVTENGTVFDLELDQSKVRIETKLVGGYIPSLITLCSLVAYELGVSVDEIREAASELEAVPHRLQLIRKDNIVIIDDAYNSNPEGAKTAVELLKSFVGTKIVITPGMIELGEKSIELHFAFGEQIADIADYAILIGRNAASIKAGILDRINSEDEECSKVGKMNLENIFEVKTLEEAMTELAKISAEKKVVLFENDLPDNY